MRRRSSWNPTSCNGNEARTRAYMVRIDTVTRLSISIDLSQSIQTVDPASMTRLAKDEKGVLASGGDVCLRSRAPT